MSDFATENIDIDIPAEPEGAPDGYDAPEAEPWAGPTQSEWEQLTGTLGYLSDIVQEAQSSDDEAWQAEQQSELEAMLDPFSDSYNPSAYVQAQVDERLAPLQGYVEHRAEQDALADAQDEAYSLIESFGVPEAEADAIYAAADNSLREAVEAFGAADINELAEAVAAQRGWDDIDATRVWIGRTALYMTAVAAQQQAQTVGGDERAVLAKYIKSPALRQSSSIQGRDEMDVVARHTLGGSS
jgi:hypothetical protein